MDLVIEKKDLKILLDKHKDGIGNYKLKEQIRSLIVIIFAVFSSEFRNIWFIRKEWLFYGYLIYVLYEIYDCVVTKNKMKKDNITSDKLLDEIVNLEKTHNHTILMVKDKYNKYANRYLLCKEVRWKNSMLFLHKKTIQDKNEHEKEIIRYISDMLHVDKNYITVKYKIEHIHTKYSKSADEYKKYRHQFYEINISNFPEQLQNDNFEIDGREYKWMTLKEMWMDEEIVKDNSDIVGYVQAIYE